MLARLRTRLTYANVMATIAVFVALGGTGYAAAKIGSAQIKNNSIQSKDIRNSTVQGKDVKNETLTGSDFKPGSLPTGATGATGATGNTGATGSPAGSYLGGRSTYCHLCGPYYSSPSGNSTGTGPLADVEIVSPARTIVARDLYVRVPDGDSNSPLFTLMLNGADSTLECTVTNASSCSDSTHAVTIPPGSKIALRGADTVGGGASYSQNFQFGWRATTP